MSGEGIGYIIAAPIVLGAVAIAGVGYAAYGMGKVVWNLGSLGLEYAKNKKKQKDTKLNDELMQDLEKINSGLKKSLQQLNAVEEQAFEEMVTTIKQQNSVLLQQLQEADGEAYQESLKQMQQVQQQVYRIIEEKSQEIEKTYAVQIEHAMTQVRKETEEKFQRLSNELAAFESAGEKRKEKAKEIAAEYIEESQKAYEACLKGFDIEAKDMRLANSLLEQLNAAKGQFQQGAYEAAIATAKSLQMAICEAVYDMEQKDLQWDNAYKMALTAAEMVTTYLENQSGFSKEAFESIKDQGIELPEELLGQQIAWYAGMENDENRYLIQKRKAERILEQLKQTTRKDCSVRELQQMAKALYEEEYPYACQLVNDSIMNMSNTYYRAEKANDFMDFLEEKGLELWEVEYVEEGDTCPDYTCPMEIVVRNPATREIVIYSLEKQKEGESPAKVEITYQLAKGEEQDESRNQYYQNLIGEFLGVKMHCKQGTTGQTSQNISPQAQKIVQEMEKY